MALFTAGLLVAPAAHAGWTTYMTSNKAKLQLCKVPLAGGSVRMKIRLNNTNGTSKQQAGLSRIDANFKYQTGVVVTAKAGTFSGTKSLTMTAQQRKAGQWFSTGMNNMGGEVQISKVARC